MQTPQPLADDAAIETVWVAAILLGCLEGLTEFIPVSSTGHLILAVDFFRIQTPPGRVFEIVIQFGAVLAVCVAYWERLWKKTTGVATDPGARRFAIGIFLAFIPAVVLGLLGADFVKESLFRPEVVAGALIVGGVIIILVERSILAVKFADSESIDPLTAFKIGLIQCAAFIPGVSRSGATIVGARLMGVERAAAAEFSFFVAIPTMFGAAAYGLYKVRDQVTTDGLLMVAVGFVAAFVSALFVVRWVIGFVSKRGLLPFAYYRIGLGLVIFALLAMGLAKPA